MKDLSDKDYQSIIARRDHRYDGRFYFGVKTTKIYCRPVCPAKPKPENILIFKSASEAEKNGYRACLRCHPDLAPNHIEQETSVQMVTRALRLIQQSPDNELKVDAMATELGVTDRHLRRLFDEHLGASPVEVLITQRLHFAKQAIRETSSPITDIAFASGFQSIRQFNDAFKTRFHRSPSEFRKAHDAFVPNSLTLRIPIRLPYDWTGVLHYLKRHESYGIERITKTSYSRFLPLKKGYGAVVVTKDDRPDFLSAQFMNIPLNAVRPIMSHLKRLFDTDHNPIHLPVVRSLESKGVRVPGSFDPFETAISIILNQLVSVDHGRAKLKTLIERFGRKMGQDAVGNIYEFPSPKILAAARLKTIGLMKSKEHAIREISKAVMNGSLRFKSSIDFQTTSKRLLAMKGIGPWTAAMMAMRCLGDPDAFPESDLIVQRAIEKKMANPAEWSSSRAYLTHCVWREFGHVLTKGRKK